MTSVMGYGIRGQGQQARCHEHLYIVLAPEVHWRPHHLETAMSIKRPSRSQPSGCARRGGAQLERYTQSYREYLLDRGGNAAGYMRRCDAAVVHLLIWMTQANKRLVDVGEELVTEFLECHLPGCHCATSARHPTTVRAALGHLLVVLRAGDAISPDTVTM